MVRKPSSPFPLVGGRLCLDFVNTIGWRGTDEPRDNVATYRELLRWGERAGALSRERARQARSHAARHPKKAARALASARALRDAMYRILVAWKRGATPGASDVSLMNRLAPPRAGIVWHLGSADWIMAETSPLDAVLWPIVWSAEDLLVSGERERLKTCGSEACGWLFYDESRSRRRRWCSMSDCGNRAKAKRFYHRGRSG